MKRLPSNIVKVDSICKNPNFKKKLFEIKNKQKYVELSHSTFTTDGSSRVNVFVGNTLYMEVIGDDTQLCVCF
jgi:hypothetical protein